MNYKKILLALFVIAALVLLCRCMRSRVLMWWGSRKEMMTSGAGEKKDKKREDQHGGESGTGDQ